MMKNRQQKQFTKKGQRQNPNHQNNRFTNEDRNQSASENPDYRHQGSHNSEWPNRQSRDQDYDDFENSQRRWRSRDEYNQSGSLRQQGYTAEDYGNDSREDNGGYGDGRSWYPSVDQQAERYGSDRYDHYGNEFSRRRQGGRQRGGQFMPDRQSNQYYGSGYDSESDANVSLGADYQRPLGASADIGFGSGRQRYSSQPYSSARGNQQGPYSGLGPKGFKRSDENLKEQVCERLQADGEVDASEIEVEVDDCVVTLTGSVTDRQQKRIAEECAESVRGIEDVHNHLTVNRDQAGRDQSGDDRGRMRGNMAGRYRSSQKSDSDATIGNGNA